MIVFKDGRFETNSMFPNSDWYNGGNHIIDETTEAGQAMAKTYIENYPFVDFEHDGDFITKVIVLEEEKIEEQERLEKERAEQELLVSLVPSQKEVSEAEMELLTITILKEANLI